MSGGYKCDGLGILLLAMFIAIVIINSYLTGLARVLTHVSCLAQISFEIAELYKIKCRRIVKY